jgi:hypothetical protein
METSCLSECFNLKTIKGIITKFGICEIYTKKLSCKFDLQLHQPNTVPSLHEAQIKHSSTFSETALCITSQAAYSLINYLENTNTEKLYWA